MSKRAVLFSVCVGLSVALWVINRSTSDNVRNCGDFSDLRMADMGDGDEKLLSVHDNKLTIGQAGIWNLTSSLDASCSATIDFKASGKPAFPPCDLVAQLRRTSIGTTQLVFTDKTGTITKDPTYPLNIWTSLNPKPATSKCASFSAAKFQDIHDGDIKSVSLSDEGTFSMSQKDIWSLETNLDEKSCKAVIDFSKTSKPAFPPVPLLAEVFISDDDIMIGFSDPSATLNKNPEYPLNIWVKV